MDLLAVDGLSVSSFMDLFLNGAFFFTLISRNSYMEYTPENRIIMAGRFSPAPGICTRPGRWFNGRSSKTSSTTTV